MEALIMPHLLLSSVMLLQILHTSLFTFSQKDRLHECRNSFLIILGFWEVNNLSLIFDIYLIFSYCFLKMSFQFLSPAFESAREDSSSLVAELQEKLQEEKAKFLEQLEEQEKRKNEEMQNVRTSLIAEQQVCLRSEEA
jgi:hypothetical protein